MITVNGKSSTSEGMTILELLMQEGYPLTGVAVECNEKIVSKADFETFRISDGDIIEIVRFVGGGSR